LNKCGGKSQILGEEDLLGGKYYDDEENGVGRRVQRNLPSLYLIQFHWQQCREEKVKIFNYILKRLLGSPA